MQQTKYITINFGADVMRIGQTQLKLWPKENLEKFVNIFKNAYPDYQVVQLGSADATRIKNVDIYVLGKSIELTKWILKKSSCHVDCEGGLVHLATQFGTKCIVIFGPTPVHMYGYKIISIFVMKNAIIAWEYTRIGHINVIGIKQALSV